MKSEYHVDDLSDDELLSRTGELVARGRRLEAVLVAHMAEVDARKLYLREACPSMFAYATERLGLSEAQAYERIGVARTSRQFPAVLAMLADGRLSLTAAARLGPHITVENAAEVLPRAVHAKKREVQALVAELAPAPDVAPVIRKLPQPAARPAVRPAGVPAPPAAVVPIAPARFKVQFTAGAELEGKIARARALLRDQIPDGDLAAIVDRAVTVLLRDLERTKFAATEKPRRSLAEADVTPRSRHIPAPVRRAVWERDGAQCTFVDKGGRRCAARERLQFHHQAPYGRGGDHDPSNVRLLCGAHNRYHAEIDFGRETVEQRVNEARRSRRDNRSRGSRAEDGHLTWPAVRRPRDHVGGGGRKGEPPEPAQISWRRAFGRRPTGRASR
jgi:5-methylcytosine-specific restriction endonuclease McrA